MTTLVRFTKLVSELNKTEELFTAKEWSDLVLNQNSTSSDILTTQSHLNLLFFLGYVSKISIFQGKLPRYSYKRELPYITLRNSVTEYAKYEESIQKTSKEIQEKVERWSNDTT